MTKIDFITFDEKIQAEWGMHKIEKAVLEKEIAELRAENEALRRDVRTAIMGDSAELQDVKRENKKLREELNEQIASSKQLRDFIVQYSQRYGRMREALKPFAYYASQIPEEVSNTASASGTVGDLRAAAAALGDTDE